MDPELPASMAVEFDEIDDGMIMASSAPVPKYEMMGSRPGDQSENIYIEELLEGFGISSPAATKWPTIYFVPMELRWGDTSMCYVPVAVRIGLCRSDLTENTKQLQSYKSCCVRQLISRWRKPEKIPPELLEGCIQSIRCLYPEIKACHSNHIKAFDGKVNVEHTMLLDGCFILHRLLKYACLKDGGESTDDDWTQIGGRCCVWQLVTRDLLLVENQIPFFVLRKLFDQLKKGDDPEDSLVKGSLMLFRSLCPQMLRHDVDTHSVQILARSDGVHHLLHLFSLMVGFPDQIQSGSSDVQSSRRQADVLPSELPQWIPGAKELEEAGIRFRKRKNAKTFLDIKFDFRTGVLEIPPLQLYDYSEALFRNLIAFEQTYPGTRFDISTYSVFMNCLVNTPEDMRILHLRGILVNMMNGEQDASRFFDRICSQIHFPSDNYLVQTMAKVSEYKDKRRHRWRAALVRDYFSNPWVAISVVAAVLLLSMTVLQTFFTVYPYFKPRN